MKTRLSFLLWISGVMANVALPSEVVTYLIERGRQADRFRINYYAAALAQLGEAEGYAWLVANSGDSLPTVSGPWPVMSRNRNLDSLSLIHI